MKIFIQTIAFLMLYSTALSQSDNLESNISNENSYMKFRSENMFSIYVTKDAKILEYPLLSNIEYTTSSNKIVKTYTPEEFVVLFNKGEIDLSYIKISRSRDHEISYRIGNTGYVLVGHSEDQIVKKYSQSIK